MVESEVPILLKRLLMFVPRVCAPTAMARATNTMSKAYSVAVAPRSSRRKRSINLRMSWSFGSGKNDKSNGLVAARRRNGCSWERRDHGVEARNIGADLV